MTELRRADRNGGEHRPDRQGEEREASVRGVGCAAAAEGIAGGDRLALSGADMAACRQARVLWGGLLDPEQAGGLSDAELGRAWTVAQCWRDVDPEAERRGARRARALGPASRRDAALRLPHRRRR